MNKRATFLITLTVIILLALIQLLYVQIVEPLLSSQVAQLLRALASALAVAGGIVAAMNDGFGFFSTLGQAEEDEQPSIPPTHAPTGDNIRGATTGWQMAATARRAALANRVPWGCFRAGVPNVV